MPYIKQDDRKKFDALVEMLGSKVENEGELNYVVTCLSHWYIKKHGLKYHNCARIRGVLQDVQDEFYRRVFVPYEEAKIQENGDIGILEVS